MFLQPTCLESAIDQYTKLETVSIAKPLQEGRGILCNRECGVRKVVKG